jgi:hypothetical protein
MRVDQAIQQFKVGQQLLRAKGESLKRMYLRAIISGASGLRAWIRANGFTTAISAFIFACLACCGNASALSLYWADNSSGADGIQIERSTPDANNFAQIATVGPSVTNFTDTGATCGVVYYYRVRAYNSAGESGYSNIAGPTTDTCCTYSLSSTSASYTSSGASDSVNVTANTSCAWTAISNVGWITITSGASGSGNGTVGYSVAANTGSSTLTGTVTIAGQTFTVIETGVACSYSLSLTGASYASGSGSDSVNMTAPNGCAWNVSNTNSWITITGGSSGAGNGTVSYSFSANTSGTTRSGVVIIGGQSYPIIQVSAACSYTLSSASASIAAGGGSSSVNVTAGSTCGWTATSNVGWITVTSGASGTGNGAVGYSVAANTSSSAITGTVTIAGQTFTVIEAGVSSCTYTLSSGSAAYFSSGSSGSVNVTAAGGCAWAVNNTNSWITITAGGSGTGNGTVSYSISANASGAMRSGVVIIGGQSYSVTQTGATCTYSLSSTSASYTSSGGSGSVNVTVASSCAWTAASNVGWITITAGASGSGNGTVSYSAAANTSSSTLTGTVTIAGQTFTVIEAGVAPCSYTLSSAANVFAANGGSYSVSVTSSGGCEWTVNNTNSWITVTGNTSGTGNGAVSYTTTANTKTMRRGALIIAGKTHTVTQLGVPCTYALSSTNASYASGGGPGSVNVTESGTCSWTAISNAGWITITSGASGMGNGTVGYSVATNTSSSALTGTVSIGSQTLTVIEGPTAMAGNQVIITNAVQTVNGLPLVLAGEEVGFSVSSTNGEQGTPTYQWSFGDGSGSTDPIPVHVFTNCGTFAVTVAINDNQGTTTANLTVAVPCSMSVTNFQATLDFAKPNLDKYTFKAIPQPSQCTNWLGTVVTIGIGDAQIPFTMDVHGRGVSTNGTCRFTYNKKTDVCEFTASLHRGNWQSSSAAYGLVNATIPKPGSAVTLPVILVIGNSAFMADKPLHYIATANKSGTAK